MAGASGRVLVVDDNRVIRQLIRVNLELEGFEVVTAADGAECLEIVHSVQPDVVTLDVVMPRLDGVRTATRLRADPRTRQVGIVMVSAGSLPEAVGGPGGVDAYVAKPFEPAVLVETVRRLARRGPRPPEPPEGPASEGRTDLRTDSRTENRPGLPAEPPPDRPQGQAAATPGPGA
ncbi:putative two-component system response regulator [Actinacidiphila reveromycinica]|uniref:Putative two-component system response regulator n=1 Tax=Actinacidiphila reveromycinica TaxID=659352 RepID=A0A7U3UX14_9ACTN|nr:response regulator [Streptomyces sp. SN-593]BBB00202.1 putative two-component system response regulator [Streptomyces sp. SN-593]